MKGTLYAKASLAVPYPILPEKKYMKHSKVKLYIDQT